MTEYGDERNSDAFYGDGLSRALSKLPERSRIVVIGQPDTGKSTFVALLARHFHRFSRRVAVVDTDVGQADLGPPGFVSYGFLEDHVGPAEHEGQERYGGRYKQCEQCQGQEGLSRQPASLRGVMRQGSYLVGSTSPYGRHLPVVTGAEACVRYAEKAGADIILVDTSGLVSPRVGVQLKCAKACAIQPHLIIALSAPGTGPLLDNLGLLGFDVVRLMPGLHVRAKTTVQRRENRVGGWNRYLHGALSFPLELSSVRVCPWWGETRYVDTGDMPTGTVVAVPDPLRPGLQIPGVWIQSGSGPTVFGALPPGYEPGSVWATSYKLGLNGKQVTLA